MIDGLILAAAADQVFMHAWDESLRLRGLEGRMRAGVYRSELCESLRADPPISEPGALLTGARLQWEHTL